MTSTAAASFAAGLKTTFDPKRLLTQLSDATIVANATGDGAVDKEKPRHVHHCACGNSDSSFKLVPPVEESQEIAKAAVETAKDNDLDPEVIKTVGVKLDEISGELYDLSLDVHAHPELAFEEHHAHDVMSTFMERHGFRVTRHYGGLETAWRADWTFGHGGRVIGVNSEMDALPGIGHACGHNLIGMSGIGVAIAIKAAMEAHHIAGKVVLLGTPAEEAGGGKIILLKNGAYKDMDVCLMSHPGPGPAHISTDGPLTAAQLILVEFKGRTAHAAAAPWEGINALDAAVAAYTSISYLRQQLHPEIRVHGIFEGHDLAPNVIPDNIKCTYLVRAPTAREMSGLVEKIRNCFYAAALATGCNLIFETEPAYFDVRQNSVLGREYGRFTTELLGMTFFHFGTSGSTDFGNVSYEMPSLHPMYSIPTRPDGGNHTVDFTYSAQTKPAHEDGMNVTKALALTGLRVLTDDAFFAEVKAAFEADEEIGNRPHARDVEQ